MIIDQDMFNIAVAVSGALGGWCLKVIWDSLEGLKKEDKELANKVEKISILVAGEYIKRSEFERLSEALFEKLDRIEVKLDRKADKHP